MKLHDVRVAILYKGDSIMIPPGWIHAVITVEESFMIDIYVFRDDWTDMTRQASKLELSFCLSGGAEILKMTEFNEILERYQQDFIMIKRLSERVDPEWTKILMDLAEEKLREIKMIEGLIKSK
jgi:Glucose-6-phosphate isomerase (GPI)